MAWYGVNHCKFVLIFSIIGDSYALSEMIILRGELMRLIIYVDNVQQYMRVLQGKFVKLHMA